MAKNAMSFIKGMGAGMVAGATAVVVGKVMLSDHKMLQRALQSL